ncbi:MAG TPA: hypothetical protein VH969_29855 [Actinophytocola sp.]|jgi:hypothetical protein|uniref:hypothetical protein n=1 Tax=Actinophytocola sp. TaxID=1872138 RepID=UPI002F948FC7
MATAPTGYWEDLAEDLRDPEFHEAYVAECRRVTEIDEAVNGVAWSRGEVAGGGER